MFLPYFEGSGNIEYNKKAALMSFPLVGNLSENSGRIADKPQ